MSLTKIFLPIGCLAAVLLAAPAARAQKACKTTADCGKGFTCMLLTVQPADNGPGVACSNANPCPVVDPTPIDAGTTITGVCVAASCTTAADCGATMICRTQNQELCPGGATPACAPNTKCDAGAPVPTSCMTKTTSTCTYKWELPCNADAECGDGFTCAPSVSGCASGGSGSGTTTGVSSSGSSGGSNASGAAPAPTDPTAPVPPDGTCTTTMSFPGSCTPKITSCNTTTDCPTAWTCVEVAHATTSMTSVAPGGAAIDGGAAGAPSSGGATPPEPAPTTKVCTPPLGTLGGVAKDGTSGPQTPQSVDGGSNAGTGNPGASGGTPMPTSGGSAAGAPSSGCAIGGGASHSPLPLSALALLGLLVARRRR